MSQRRTFMRGAMSLVAASALAAIAAAPPAAAASTGAGPPPGAGNVIEVDGTSTGFTMVDRHPAGFVTFTARTSHPDGGLFALLRLRHGADLDEVLGALEEGLSDDRAESVAGGRAVQDLAEVLGGAAVLPGQPASFSSLLLPGSYHVVNYQDLWEGGVSQAAERLQPLTITGRWSATAPPHTSATSVFTFAGDQARYRMPTELRSGEPIRMINAMPQLTEAVFMPVQPGTTRAQLAEFFAAADQDDWSVPFPFTGGPVGLPALSPGRSTILQVDLAPGEYALVTWYPNFDNGTMLAAQGQFELVKVR